MVSQPLAVNVFVIRESSEALLVDTGMGQDLQRILPKLREVMGGARCVGIHLTHPHADHVAAARAFHAAFAAPVTIEERDAPIVEKGDDVATLGTFLGVAQEPCPVVGVREGSVLRVGSTNLEVLCLPGHTPHHSALWDRGTRRLLSGDVIFPAGSFGRVDFPGGDPNQLIASLARLAQMRPEAIYPGHMDPIEKRAREAIEESLENARGMFGVV
ncbi:MAG: MBL fold metallo-hydrolase [Thermoplasmatota archaeon]